MVKKNEIDYKRNIFLIFIIFFLYAFSVSWAVIQILFFQELSLSFSQISFLLLVLYLAILVKNSSCLF